MDDLRRPIGYLFGLLGLIILIYGIAEPNVRAPLDPGANVNLWCGLMLLVFGVVLFCLSLRSKRS
jgi:hypothetical protein